MHGGPRFGTKYDRGFGCVNSVFAVAVFADKLCEDNSSTLRDSKGVLAKHSPIYHGLTYPGSVSVTRRLCRPRDLVPDLVPRYGGTTF